MSIDFRNTALMVFLRGKQPELYGKVAELRDVVQNWLSYIPQTFPHYTRHTVLHSDAIVLQVSKLLFRDNEAAESVVNLSAIEAYILAASAYLHDAGMVVSDREKQEILGSDPWRAWTGKDGAGAKRWKEIETFRSGESPSESGVRNFLADVQTRFLIGEFIRRTHHLRAREFMTEHEGQLGSFAFGDPMLLRTIADVCVAHGLQQSELEDQDRYPDRRDIQGQQVNVRFLAILLRLGDLLDMSTDRACPLLLNAACPMPAESLAHWTQYQCLSHSLTSPDRIEITALCKNQEEHRYLKDWCQWLVNEVQNAAILMARSARHKDWQVPTTTIDRPQATIKIQPAAKATYIPSSWRFELDHDLVFRRLIDDLYAEPHSFVRELIQNALDATRCQMYIRLREEAIEAPEFPTQVPEERRQRFPLKLSLETRELKNLLSGEVEKRHVLTIEDSGIGMDREIIQRYLLQVGRSYYTTYDFRKNFKFVPTSRFGVGFLSVFSASDYVSIDTYKPSSGSDDGPLRLVLTGPRNYLLLEKGGRRKSGTRIEVLLREALEPFHLTELVSSWCRRVEFPIYVQEFGTESVITPERKEQFTYEIPDVVQEGAKFAVRAFDIQRYGIEGELYVFMRIDSHGESWDAWSDARYNYPRKDPRASKPSFPKSLRCINGIAVGLGYGEGPISERLDFRGGSIPVPALSREHMRLAHRSHGELSDARVTSRWVEIIKDHLATSQRAASPDGWRYKQALVDDFSTADFWASLPGTIPIHAKEGARLVSLQELQELPLMATLIGPHDLFPTLVLPVDRKSMPEPVWDEEVWAIFGEELKAISKNHTASLFQRRSVHSARWLPSEHFVMYWKKEDGDIKSLGGPSHHQSRLVELTDSFTVGFRIHSTTDSPLESVLFNAANPLIQWLLRIKKASAEGVHGLSNEHYERLFELLYETCSYLYKVDEVMRYVQKWHEMRGLPSDLYPPALKLLPQMFLRQLIRPSREPSTD